MNITPFCLFRRRLTATGTNFVNVSTNGVLVVY
jgi:hypothetical protein